VESWWWWWWWWWWWVALEVVVHHDMTQLLDVLHLIQMIVASPVMNEVTIHMIAHVLEVVVTVEDAKGKAQYILVNIYCVKSLYFLYCGF
jgi:hypothetical protein